MDLELQVYIHPSQQKQKQEWRGKPEIQERVLISSS